MHDSLTYIFPRTMEQAFGPYARLTVEDKPVQLCEGDELIVATCAVALVALLIIMKVWG